MSYKINGVTLFAQALLCIGLSAIAASACTGQNWTYIGDGGNQILDKLVTKTHVNYHNIPNEHRSKIGFTAPFPVYRCRPELTRCPDSNYVVIPNQRYQKTVRMEVCTFVNGKCQKVQVVFKEDRKCRCVHVEDTIDYINEDSHIGRFHKEFEFFITKDNCTPQ